MVRPNIEHLAESTFHGRHSQEPAAGILDEGKVAGGSQISQLDLAMSGRKLRNDSRNYGAGGLAGPISVKRACDNDGQFEGLIKA